MRWLGGIIDVMDMNLGKLQEMVRDRQASSPWSRKELDTTGQLNINRGEAKDKGGGDGETQDKAFQNDLGLPKGCF